MKLMKNKYVRIAVLIVVILVFFVISEYSQNKETSIAIDRDVFTVADSKQELHAKLVQGMIGEKSELMESVYEHDLVQTLNLESVTALDQKRDVQFHEFWNDGFELYLVYSINLLPEDEAPDTVPNFQFKGITLHNGEETISTLREDIGLKSKKEGVVYNGRLYRTIWAQPQLSEDLFQRLFAWSGDKSNTYTSIEKAILKIDQVTLNDVLLMDEIESLYQLNELVIKKELQSSNPKIGSQPLNETVKLEDGSEIVVKELSKHIKGNRLYIELPPELTKIIEFEYIVNGIYLPAIITDDLQGRTYLHLDESVKDKDNLKIQFKQLQVATDKQFEIKIEHDQFEVFKTKLNGESRKNEIIKLLVEKEFGEAYGVKYSLTELIQHTDGTVGIGIRTVTKDSQSKWVRFRDNSKEDIGYRSYIEISDGNGDKVHVQSHRGTSDNEGTIIYYVVSKEDILNAKDLNIRIFQLPKTIQFEENIVDILYKE